MAGGQRFCLKPSQRRGFDFKFGSKSKGFAMYMARPWVRLKKQRTAPTTRGVRGVSKK